MMKVKSSILVSYRLHFQLMFSMQHGSHSYNHASLSMYRLLLWLNDLTRRLASMMDACQALVYTWCITSLSYWTSQNSTCN